MAGRIKFVQANPAKPEEIGRPEEDDPILARMKAENPGVPLHKMDGYLFDSEGHTQMCVLPKGHRFVVIVGGLAPVLLGDEEPGEYVFSAPPPPEGGDWPQMLMVVENANVRAVMNMDGTATAEMVKMITGYGLPAN